MAMNQADDETFIKAVLDCRGLRIGLSGVSGGDQAESTREVAAHLSSEDQGRENFLDEPILQSLCDRFAF